MRTFGLLLIAATSSLVLAGKSAGGAATVTKFTFTGDTQSIVVPEGVTTMHVVAIGGRGGQGAQTQAVGGFGAVVSADVAVTPGKTVIVVVGGNGGDAAGAVGGKGGFGGLGSGGDGGSAKSTLVEKGGGGGGGMSYAYVDGEGVLPGFLVGAAGGGGSGGGRVGGAGGNGSGDNGTNGQAGNLGAPTNATPGGGGGGGGTTTAPGGNGKFFAGGAGIFGFADNSGGGGGGGAGVFGGGGGGEGDTDGNGGGGGAGSSSASSTNATNASYTRDTTGVPSITFTYATPSTPGGGGGNPGAGGGGNQGGGNSPALAPALSKLKAAPKTFAAASRGGSTGGTVGTTISYTAATAGTTTFTVLAPRRGVSSAARCVKPKRGKHGKRCTRYVSLGSFTHKDVAGFNTFVFTGRVRRHRLARGSYKLQGVSSANGHKSRAVTLSFRVVG